MTIKHIQMNLLVLCPGSLNNNKKGLDQLTDQLICTWMLNQIITVSENTTFYPSPLHCVSSLADTCPLLCASQKNLLVLGDRRGLFKPC